MEGKQKHKAGWALNAGPLTSQKLFKWALSILTFIVFGAVAASVWDLPFDPSPAGVRNFLSHIRDVVPLAALAVAIIVLIARAHATVQAAEQIERAGRQIQISEGQNAFNNYYKHLDILRERFKGAHEHKGYTLDLDGAYRYLFPHNGPSQFIHRPDPVRAREMREKADEIYRITHNEEAHQYISLQSFMELVHEWFARPRPRTQVRAATLSGPGGQLDQSTAVIYAGLSEDLFAIIDFAGLPLPMSPAHIADTTVADQGPAPE